MKKIAIIKSIAFWALMPLLLLIMSCSNTDDEVGISGRNMTLSVIMPDDGTTRVELAQDGDSKNYITQWDEADEVQVFITQGSQRYAIGKVGVKNISEDKKNASITFALPEALDLNKSYSIYALSGIEGTIVEDVGKWYLTCTAELYRNVLTYFNAPLYCKMDVDNDLYPRLQFKHIGAYEVLHFTNATDKTIKFEHRGFYVEKPWYFKKAVGYLLPEGGVALDTDAAVYGDVESEFFYVAAGQTTTLISWYIPTQEKMNGAELKAAIDGIAIKSANKKSSSVSIETGHAYHMYATWDGTNLTFDNGDAGILTVEPNPIEFGSVEAGTTAIGTFTVSNTGNANISFEIQSMHTTIFDIPESGKSFTLKPDESLPFTITFSPEAETKDKPYSEMMTITTNASNGTQYITITGKSESREEVRLDQVIPEEIRNKMEEHIPIYDGANPPNIEGGYVISPCIMTFDSKGGYEYGHQFADSYIRFHNQDMVNNTLDYQEQQSSSQSIGTGCFISGEGDKFSIYFNTEGVTNYSEYDITFKTALIISGIKTDEGIQDLYYAFVMVDKSDDPKPYIMAVGDYRVIKDGDGISYPYSWASVKKRVSAKDWHLPGIMEVKRK